ncbi:hypothetical protein SteCoe_28307 [Stentor coeruleus]|uniref:SANT domain-containing protein n=1 Tax=Stentor coeruleus TaxID=5963 RepID=A0A1R2B914_9CILI|nr:hypothetical protein SteCoe_28307 [Stentor coeruleus]
MSLDMPKSPETATVSQFEGHKESENKSLLDFCDWSSNGSSSDISISSLSNLNLNPLFKPVQPSIFKKASRKWLNSNSQNYYSQTKNTLEMSKDKVLAGKALQSFENYLSTVTMMYFGDPHPKSKETTEIFRPGKRARSSQLNDPLSMILSPLRSELDFESWSPKEIAVFESVMCMFGKKFDVVGRLLEESKTLQEITRFYYIWKKTSHYKSWKEAVKEQLGNAL